jgi:hypothetical protein
MIGRSRWDGTHDLSSQQTTPALLPFFPASFHQLAFASSSPSRRAGSCPFPVADWHGNKKTLAAINMHWPIKLDLFI